MSVNSNGVEATSNRENVNGNAAANGTRELISDDDMDFDGSYDVQRIFRLVSYASD